MQTHITQKKPKGLVITAYHEAGHALAHFLLGRVFEYVTITTNMKTHLSGYVKGHTPFDVFTSEILFTEDYMQPILKNEIMIFFAGHAVEEILTGNTSWQQAQSDFEKSSYIANYIIASPKYTFVYLQELYLETVAMFRNHFVWNAVQAIANKLLKSPTLNYMQARAILSQLYTN